MNGSIQCNRSKGIPINTYQFLYILVWLVSQFAGGAVAAALFHFFRWQCTAFECCACVFVRMSVNTYYRVSSYFAQQSSIILYIIKLYMQTLIYNFEWNRERRVQFSAFYPLCVYSENAFPSSCYDIYFILRHLPGVLSHWPVLVVLRSYFSMLRFSVRTLYCCSVITARTSNDCGALINGD